MYLYYDYDFYGSFSDDFFQSQFKQKIECLEKQLQEERERAKAAEGLLQQVKTTAAACKRNS